MELYKIVFTGGPCAGKSSIIKNLKKRLTDMNYSVFIVSETARELMDDGVKPKEDYDYTIKFQNSIMEIQKLKESIIEDFAKEEAKKNPTIILYDRSIIDNRAYLPTQKDYENLLKANNLDEIDVLEKYDLVIHLASLATVDYLNYENDDIRIESKDFSKVLDKNTINAYLLHKNLKIVMPTENFLDKEEIVMSYIEDLLKHINRNECEYQIINTRLDLARLEISAINNGYRIGLITEYDCLTKELINKKIVEKKYDDKIVYEEIKGDFYDYSNQIISKEEFELMYNSGTLDNKRSHIDITFVNNYEIYKILKYNDHYELEIQKNRDIENSKKLKK